MNTESTVGTVLTLCLLPAFGLGLFVLAMFDLRQPNANLVEIQRRREAEWTEMIAQREEDRKP